MPRCRITVRWMMVAVALLGLGMGTLVLRQRAADYARKAAEFAHKEGICLYAESRVIDSLRAIRGDHPKRTIQDGARNLEMFVIVTASHWRPIRQSEHDRRFVPIVPSDRIAALARWGPSAVAYYSDLSRWNGSLRRKYARLARYPWLPLDPDPPMPKPPDDPISTPPLILT
jgi:hypothetical protein